ncbi:MAG: type II secretion system protein [Actinobacteria bacterium]|nr:type II secretion system protein [Actinomycetota bacterium]
MGKIVGKGKGKGSNRQGGFTVVELAVSILLVGISLSVVTLAYASSRRSMLITSGTDEVESLMRRAYNIAMQEGVDVYLQFWDASGSHPNRCAIYRVYPDGRDERDNDEPTETPPPGVSADTDGEGHFWFKIAEGSVSVQSPVTLLFRREGALVTVSSVQGGMSVTITLSGLSRTITINERGEVSS